MGGCVVNINIPASWPCMWPSTTTRAWPSHNCCPIRRPIPLAIFCAPRCSSSPATASASAHCSPTMAPVIDRESFVWLACRCSSTTAAPGPTRQEPTAKPSALSRPRCANGPTQNTGPIPTNAMPASSLGPTITTTNALMVASTTSRPSAAPRLVQRLEHLQAPRFLDGGTAMSLFDGEPEGPSGPLRTAPLAERMRPRSLEEFSGQEHLVGAGKPLRVQIEHDGLDSSGSGSMILWGPPGVGKTTLAKIIAET